MQALMRLSHLQKATQKVANQPQLVRELTITVKAVCVKEARTRQNGPGPVSKKEMKPGHSEHLLWGAGPSTCTLEECGENSWPRWAGFYHFMSSMCTSSHCDLSEAQLKTPRGSQRRYSEGQVPHSTWLTFSFSFREYGLALLQTHQTIVLPLKVLYQLTENKQKRQGANLLSELW